MSDASPFAGMSPAIVAMLRDEANLSTGRSVLDEARQAAVSQITALRAQRPAFGFLGSKKQRDDYATALAAQENQLAMIDGMVGRVDDARERIQPGLRAALVAYLHQIDPMYRQGFRASRFHEHWRRAHAVVTDRMKAFTQGIQLAQDAIDKDVARQRTRYTTDTLWNLAILKKSAVEVDRESESLNRVCGEFAAAVNQTPFAAISLPAIEIFGCSRIIDTLTLRSVQDGAVEVDSLMTEFTELRLPELQKLLFSHESAAEEHARIAERRLSEYWSSVLTQAEAYLVSDADLESTLQEIEQRQAEAERMRSNDRSNKSLDESH